MFVRRVDRRVPREVFGGHRHVDLLRRDARIHLIDLAVVIDVAAGEAGSLTAIRHACRSRCRLISKFVKFRSIFANLWCGSEEYGGHGC